MTDIEQKALALVNEVLGEWGKDVRYSSLGRLGNSTSEALFRAIEKHEAFKQEVSDAVEAVLDRYYVLNIEDMLSQFIIPKPKPKPDPLVEVLKDLSWGREPAAADLRAALEARGFEIRKKNDD
jgi:hypothetical protein